MCFAQEKIQHFSSWKMCLTKSWLFSHQNTFTSAVMNARRRIGNAANAMVMSWRGENGGIAAAHEKHNVIMTPGDWVYLNYSQTRNEDSVTIGGYLPLEKVYRYEPVPAALTADEKKYVLGAQGELWTEYIGNEKIAEYMLFPRMTALSEVLWSKKKDSVDFKKRLVTQVKRYHLWKANYSKAGLDLAGVAPPESMMLVKRETSNVKWDYKRSGEVSKR
jgi:N-acetyl-beta-hexosaminidase